MTSESQANESTLLRRTRNSSRSNDVEAQRLKPKHLNDDQDSSDLWRHTGFRKLLSISTFLYWIDTGLFWDHNKTNCLFLKHSKSSTYCTIFLQIFVKFLKITFLLSKWCGSVVVLRKFYPHRTGLVIHNMNSKLLKSTFGLTLLSNNRFFVHQLWYCLLGVRFCIGCESVIIWCIDRASYTLVKIWLWLQEFIFIEVRLYYSSDSSPTWKKEITLSKCLLLTFSSTTHSLCSKS